MSNAPTVTPTASRLPPSTRLPKRKPVSRLASLGVPKKAHDLRNPSMSRRASVAGLVSAKAQRTSKTTHKLVELPSAPQTRPLLADREEDLTLGHEIDGEVREYKSQAERMSKDQRKEAGFKRLTAYCVAESFKMKLLSSFLKREHNVSPRAFDEALYVVSGDIYNLAILLELQYCAQMYHLPLLPGYGPNANVRSSAPSKMKTGRSFLAHLSEAEENGYQGTYFTTPTPQADNLGGYISSSSPVEPRKSSARHHFLPPVDLPVPHLPPHAETDNETDLDVSGFATEPEIETPYSEQLPGETPQQLDIDPGAETDPGPGIYNRWKPPREEVPSEASKRSDDDVAEVVFFEYGVVVFFGLAEDQERDILEDIDNAGIMKRKIEEEDWEIEECHFTVSQLQHTGYLSFSGIN
jgi:uncharacterized Rmd1/YagE family protein